MTPSSCSWDITVKRHLIPGLQNGKDTSFRGCRTGKDTSFLFLRKEQKRWLFQFEKRAETVVIPRLIYVLLHRESLIINSSVSQEVWRDVQNVISTWDVNFEQNEQKVTFLGPGRSRRSSRDGNPG